MNNDEKERACKLEIACYIRDITSTRDKNQSVRAVDLLLFTLEEYFNNYQKTTKG